MRFSVVPSTTMVTPSSRAPRTTPAEYGSVKRSVVCLFLVVCDRLFYVVKKLVEKKEYR